MKKNALLLFTVLLFFSSCKKSADVKIALMFPYTTGSRMAIEEKVFREKAAEFNCEVIVTDAQSDEATQRKQANELLAQGVKVLVIMSVNAFTAAEIVRNAHEAGSYVIGYDRLILTPNWIITYRTTITMLGNTWPTIP
jgi:ABC-type xylose transport system substrate-binding protein